LEETKMEFIELDPNDAKNWDKKIKDGIEKMKKQKEEEL